MRGFLEEYGKAAVGAVIGILMFLFLFHRNGLLSFVDQLKPKNYDVTNARTAERMKELNKRKKPELIVESPYVELGTSFRLEELVLSAVDAEGKDIRNQMSCYLEDGTEVPLSYEVHADTLKTRIFRFHAEDSQNVYTEIKHAIVVHNNSLIPDAERVLERWELGDNVSARLLVSKGDGEKEQMAISIEGEGKARRYTSASQVPWNKYRKTIAECRIAETVATPYIDYWFTDCTELKEVPKLREVETMIGAFSGCASLKTAYLPEGVINAKEAYKNCGEVRTAMMESTILENIQNLFYGCRKLRGKLVINSAPSSFEGCFEQAVLDTNGITLKVYAGNTGIEGSVASMVNSWNYEQIVYMGSDG